MTEDKQPEGSHAIEEGEVARPLRIEFEDAFYHVTARGNEWRKIFEGLEKNLSKVKG